MQDKIITWFVSPHMGSGCKSLWLSTREQVCLYERHTLGTNQAKLLFLYSGPQCHVFTMSCFKPLRGHVFTFQVRSEVIATYALCGFANFGSLGLVIGGLSKKHSHGQFFSQANPKESAWRNRMGVKLANIRAWAAALPRPSTQLWMEGHPEGYRFWCGSTGRGAEGKGKEPSPSDSLPCLALKHEPELLLPMSFRRSRSTPQHAGLKDEFGCFL